MKVLYIFSRDEIGGAPRSTYTMLKILADQFNVKPIIVTPKHTIFNDLADNDGFENYVLKYNYNGTSENASFIRIKGKSLINFFLDRWSINKLAKKIDMSSIDLIHTSMSILELGYLINNKFQIPHIVHIREGIKAKWKYLNSKQISIMNKYSQRFILISNYILNRWIDEGLDKSKARLIYNGIDISNINYNENKPSFEFPIKIAIVGQIVELKGQLDFLKAFCSLPTAVKGAFKIDVIGQVLDSEYFEEIMKLLKQTNSTQFIDFKGFNSNINEELTNYDIGVMSSKEEAFGRVTIEYMLAGLCVIACDGGATRELVADNKTGLLYSWNSQELKKILIRIANREIDFKQIGSKSRKHAADNFNALKNAELVYKQYLNILNGV